LHLSNHPFTLTTVSAPAGRADYFGSVPNLAARLMAVAQPGQLLVDGQLASIRDLQWREDGCAVLLSQQAGAVEFTQLGYLQVKVGGWLRGWVQGGWLVGVQLLWCNCRAGRGQLLVEVLGWLGYRIVLPGMAGRRSCELTKPSFARALLCA
jgi:hypothetical protein